MLFFARVVPVTGDCQLAGREIFDERMERRYDVLLKAFAFNRFEPAEHEIGVADELSVLVGDSDA